MKIVQHFFQQFLSPFLAPCHEFGEAWAASKPVIATTCGGPRDFVGCLKNPWVSYSNLGF